MYKIIKLNQEDWLKACININTELRKNNGKNDFKKELIKLTTNTIFVKTMKNVRKHKDTQLVAI